jgi:two-component system nitrate/nitrite response regulator NarL
MRLEGLVSIFDQPVANNNLVLIPVVCSLEEILKGSTLQHLILELTEAGSGAQTIHAILRVCPGLRVIVVGQQGNDGLAMEAISAGAKAYLNLNSDIDVVRQAVEVVIGGSIYGPHRLLSKLVDRLLHVSDSSLTGAPPQLTDREKQVVELIMAAQSNGEIARKLGIGPQTVTAHVGRLMRKTGTVNRVGLASFMRKSPGFAFENQTQSTS